MHPNPRTANIHLRIQVLKAHGRPPKSQASQLICRPAAQPTVTMSHSTQNFPKP